jgi:hypothetical protein
LRVGCAFGEELAELRLFTSGNRNASSYYALKHLVGVRCGGRSACSPISLRPTSIASSARETPFSGWRPDAASYCCAKSEI